MVRRQDKDKTERGQNWHDSKQPYWYPSFTENVKFFYVEVRTLIRHKLIGVFVVYIDTGSSMLKSKSKSCDLAEMIWNNRIGAGHH
jgi:hypothetical protein